MQKGKFNEEEMSLFQAIELRKAEIQSEIDSLLEVLRDEQKTAREHNLAKEGIKELRPKLVPFAEMQAGLANANSRDKYFPDITKSGMVAYVKKELGL